MFLLMQKISMTWPKIVLYMLNMCKYNFCVLHWVQGHVLERDYLVWEAKIKDNTSPKGYCSINGTILIWKNNSTIYYIDKVKNFSLF